MYCQEVGYYESPEKALKRPSHETSLSSMCLLLLQVHDVFFDFTLGIHFTKILAFMVPVLFNFSS